jgi:hypothetical protein
MKISTTLMENPGVPIQLNLCDNIPVWCHAQFLLQIYFLNRNELYDTTSILRKESGSMMAQDLQTNGIAGRRLAIEPLAGVLDWLDGTLRGPPT